MMDYFALFVPFFALLVAFVVGLMFKGLFDRQVSAKALSITNTKAGELGREKKEKQEGELMALLQEAGLAFKAAKDSNEDMKAAAARIVPSLMAKYPTVIMKHGKKLMKMMSEGGGFEAFEDFL